MKSGNRNDLRIPFKMGLALACALVCPAERLLGYGTGGDISVFMTPDGQKVDVGFGILDEFDAVYEFLDPNDSVFDNVLIPHTPKVLPPIPWTYASSEPGFDAFFGTLPPLKKLTANMLELKYWNGAGALSFSLAAGVTAGDAPQPMLTQAGGGFHAHPEFGVAGAVSDGIYLAKMSVSIETLLDSDPWYMVALVDHRLYTGNVETDIENAEAVGDLVHAYLADPLNAPLPIYQGYDYKFYADAIAYAESLPVPEPGSILLLLSATVFCMHRRMRWRNQGMIVLAAMTLAVAASPQSADAHNGGVVVQLKSNKIVVGSDTEQPGDLPDMTARVFQSLLRPDLYGQDIPSFLSLSDAPTGTDPLPPVTNVYWDFLPMTANGVTSNLLYWNGQGTTVASVNFGAVPQAGVTFGLYNVTDGASTLVSATPDMVAGDLLGITELAGSGLRMHRHNFFLLDDGDGGVPPTTVPEGVYLLSMQLRMNGYIASDPFYVVADTFNHFNGQGLDPLNAALAWVGQNTDTLVRPGDYNFDGQVNAGDYATWRSQFGSSGPFPINGDYADGNRDGKVDASDYVLWRNHLSGGAAGASAGTPAAVPEPASLLLLALPTITWTLRKRKRT